jgi:3-oxoacyl-(acyl-carrier-protein) synthase
MAARRVAITGLGIICPLGLNVAETWEALRNGRPAIGPIQGVDYHSLTLGSTQPSISNPARKTISTGSLNFPWWRRGMRCGTPESN